MKLDIRRIQLTCSVKGCTNVEDGMPLDRHHVRSQKMWVTAFSSRHYWSKKYQDFKARYEQFNELDLVRLCREHHEEVHDFYYRIVEKWKLKFQLPLHLMSWRQAEIIMKDLDREFHKWLTRKNSRKNASFFRTLRKKR